MQQSYFGSVEAINDPRNVELIRIALTTQSSPLLRRKKRPESFSSLQEVKLQTDDTIKVNVSGKCFAISTTNLARYPNSLLSNEEKRKVFYDMDKEEYFFDHNRMIVRSVSLFYEYGFFEIPENVPEHLVVEELNFFGLYDYLDDGIKGHLGDAHQISDTHTAKNLREKLWIILESPDGVGNNECARCYNVFSLSLIVFSIFLLCYATYYSGHLQVSLSTFDNVAINWVLLSEIICIGFFSIELFLRFIVSHEKRRFFFSFLNIIDFVAITPFYIGIILDVQHITTPLTVLRVLRIGKVFRVLKISRYNTSLLIIGKTIKSGRWDLWMLCFLLVIACLFYGSITYYMEQIFMEDESEFHSIPAAIWWALITSLSIGYGNMVPKSSGLC